MCHLHDGVEMEYPWNSERRDTNIEHVDKRFILPQALLGRPGKSNPLHRGRIWHDLYQCIGYDVFK